MLSELEYKNYSISNLVKFINEAFNEVKLNSYKPSKNEFIKSMLIWYRGVNTYSDDYDDYLIKKPIYIKITTSRQRFILLKHEAILNLFNCKPVIRFKQTITRIIPRGNDRLNYYSININFKSYKTNNGFQYYPLSIYQETSNNVIKTISNSVISFGKNEVKCEELYENETENN